MSLRQARSLEWAHDGLEAAVVYDERSISFRDLQGPRSAESLSCTCLHRWRLNVSDCNASP